MSFDAKYMKRADPEQVRRLEEFHTFQKRKVRTQKRTAADEQHRAKVEQAERARMKRLSSIRPVDYSLVDRDPSERA